MLTLFQPIVFHTSYGFEKACEKKKFGLRILEKFGYIHQNRSTVSVCVTSAIFNCKLDHTVTCQVRQIFSDFNHTCTCVKNTLDMFFRLLCWQKHHIRFHLEFLWDLNYCSGCEHIIELLHWHNATQRPHPRYQRLCKLATQFLEPLAPSRCTLDRASYAAPVA